LLAYSCFLFVPPYTCCLEFDYALSQNCGLQISQ
jgi:hypothetical protein